MNHADEARRLVHRAETTDGEVNDDASAFLSVQTAQVHATLELAEQQRVANLIALESLAPGSTNLRNLTHTIGRTQ